MKPILHFIRPAALAAGLAAILLSGCDLLGGGKSAPVGGVSGLTSLWIGKPLDSLANAQSLEYRDGRLYVANRHPTLPGTAVVDTATGLIVEYYPQLIPPAAMAFTQSGSLVVTEGVFGSDGGVSVIDPSAKRIRQSVITFEQDNAVVADGDRVYLIDRTFGVVTGFTGNTPGQNVVLDAQTGANSNPQGIAVADGKAFVPRWDLGSLLILGDVNLIGGGARDSVDLSAYSRDSSSGAPRMGPITAHGGYVFVALQRLNAQFAAQDTSLVVIINASTKAITGTIPLTFKNPVSGYVRDGVWYLSGVAGYGDLLGGVEKIDLAARIHTGVVTTEGVLGGDVSAFVATAGSGYAIVATGAWPNTRYGVNKVSP